MPALITHDFFGRDVYDRLYTCLLYTSRCV